ncbi:MAG: tripartite tricarboxylate transporter substrate binding protein [Burkholderiaceae bacterium]|nr:tripartite tricarboxylate transporter substrate binding protein [Burkholderiaceae bacterium]
MSRIQRIDLRQNTPSTRLAHYHYHYHYHYHEYENMTSQKVPQILCLLAALALIAPAANGQSYPDRVIKLIVGYPPGGSADVTARVIAEKLTRVLGQPVVVDNRAGAAQNIAAEYVAKSTADGYTLLFGSSSLTINPFLYKDLKYDTVADFAPVSLVVTLPLLVSINPKVSATDLKSFVQLARAKPGVYNYGTSGNGSLGHLSVESFKQRSGVFITHIPYRGSAQMLNGLMAGDVSMTFDAVSSGLELAKAGKVRALAITGKKRSPMAPEIPTLTEAGFPGYELYGWYGVLAPRKTPAPIVASLNAAIGKVLAMPEVVAILVASGNEITPNTPDAFASLIRDDLTKYGAEVKRTGAKLD